MINLIVYVEFNYLGISFIDICLISFVFVSICALGVQEVRFLGQVRVNGHIHLVIFFSCEIHSFCLGPFWRYLARCLYMGNNFLARFGTIFVFLLSFFLFTVLGVGFIIFRYHFFLLFSRVSPFWMFFLVNIDVFHFSYPFGFNFCDYLSTYCARMRTSEIVYLNDNTDRIYVFVYSGRLLGIYQDDCVGWHAS